MNAPTPTRRPLPGSRLLRFGLVGALGFAADGGAMHLLGWALGVDAVWVRPFSFAVAVTLTWWLNRHLTFAQTRSDAPLAEWRRYVASSLGGAAVNLAVFYLCVLTSSTLANQPLAALAIASGVAMFFNYEMTRRYVFRHVAP